MPPTSAAEPPPTSSSCVSNQLTRNSTPKKRVGSSTASRRFVSWRWSIKPMKINRVFAFAAASAVLLIAGCRQDMQNEPKMIPQRGTTMFADGRSARPQVVNTVARGQLNEDQYFYTGL